MAREGCAHEAQRPREAETMTKPNCYDCQWRREAPGDAHSSCANPKIAGFSDPLVERLAFLVNVRKAAAELNIVANAHGVRRGWFNWPYNFDPTWLENCDGFTPKATP
jgi:hypothetical protein